MRAGGCDRGRASDLVIGNRNLDQVCAEITPFEILEQFVAVALRDDISVLHALVGGLPLLATLPLPSRWRRKGLQSVTDSVPFQEQLGALIVQAESRVRMDGSMVTSTSRLEEAVNLLSFALLRAKAKKEIARLRYTRAMAYELLNRLDMAETDFRAACENDANDGEIAFQFGLLLARTERNDDAIDVLMRISEHNKPHKADLLLAQLLRNEIVREITQWLWRFSKPPSQLQSRLIAELAELAAMLTRLCTRMGKHDEALRILDSLPPGYLSDAVHLAVRADTLCQSGRREDGLGFARQALAALGPNSSDDDQFRVAETLYFLGEYRDALSIWKRLITATHNVPFNQMALECAKEGRR